MEKIDKELQLEMAKAIVQNDLSTIAAQLNEDLSKKSNLDFLVFLAKMLNINIVKFANILLTMNNKFI